MVTTGESRGRGTDRAARCNFFPRLLRAGHRAWGEARGGWDMRRFFLMAVLCLSFSAKGQTISLFAGGGTGGDGGPATAASIVCPEDMVVDRNGNLYFTEYLNHRVRKVSVTGIISTIAGNGAPGFSGDNGPASSAQVRNPSGITIDQNDNVIFCDQENNRIRKIDALTGIITTIAGNGSAGFSGDDGLATAASLNHPYDVHLDKVSGNIYIADNVNYRMRKIDVTTNIITTIAGNGIATSTGDGGAATAATCGPASIFSDASGNLYFTDGVNYTVRKITSSGTIETVAGIGGSYIYNGDEIPATAAAIAPGYITISPIGLLCIPDAYNDRVRGINGLGIISTIAGDGTPGFSGDGTPATAAKINNPNSVAFDDCGNMYIAQLDNPRIRKVTYPPILTTPTISLNSTTSSASLGSSVTINATVSNAGSSYLIHWLNRGVEFTTTTVPSVTYSKAAGTDTITARVVSTATYGCYDSTTSAGWVVTASAMATSGLAEGAKVLCMWPIPTKDVLHIDDVSVVSSYRVISMVGAMQLQGELKAGSNAIHVRDLPAGMYMVEITGNDGKRTVKKIIRQ